MPWHELISLIVLGFVAGALGGMLGIGGSIVMIPVLTLLLHREQQLSQATAMIVNFFVSAPALWRHHQARAVDWMIVRRMLPAGIICIIAGVYVSNVLGEAALRAVFGVFLLYVAVDSARKFFDGSSVPDTAPPRPGWMRVSLVAGITGFAAGLLGIGGGILAVPLLHHVCHLSLRRSIAVSAAVMCATATVGAVVKNLTLESLGLDPYTSLFIAGCLAPTAIIGGLSGATLTHILPIKWLRLAMTLLLFVGGVKYLWSAVEGARETSIVEEQRRSDEETE